MKKFKFSIAAITIAAITIATAACAEQQSKAICWAPDGKKYESQRYHTAGRWVKLEIKNGETIQFYGSMCIIKYN